MSDADSADGGDYGGKGVEDDVDMGEDGDVVDQDGADVRVGGSLVGTTAAGCACVLATAAGDPCL